MSVLMGGGPDLLSLQVLRWIRTVRHVTWSAPAIWDGASMVWAPLLCPKLHISLQTLGRGFLRVSPVQGAGIPEPPPHHPPAGSTQRDKEGESAQPLPLPPYPAPPHLLPEPAQLAIPLPPSGHTHPLSRHCLLCPGVQIKSEQGLTALH